MVVVANLARAQAIQQGLSRSEALRLPGQILLPEAQDFETIDMGPAAALRQPNSLASVLALPSELELPSHSPSGMDADEDQGCPCETCQPGQPGRPCLGSHGGPAGDLQWFRNSQRDGRHTGKGQPLLGTSWLNRPYHIGWFLGALFGDDLIDGRVRQGNDFFGGYEMGWDVDHYWGTQLRLAWAAMPVNSEPEEPYARNGDVFHGDVSLLYYPWGDARWRPYALVGLGVGNFSFVDDVDVLHDTTLLAMPLGGGVKYQFRRWLALRAELADNISFADEGINSMHNISLTIGVELHWGAQPQSYWPWRTGPHVW